MNANELARFINDFIFAEKEIVLEALKTNNENMILDEAYEYIQNCDKD